SATAALTLAQSLSLPIITATFFSLILRNPLFLFPRGGTKKDYDALRHSLQGVHLVWLRVQGCAKKCRPPSVVQKEHVIRVAPMP
ncbi:MAG: hypothetical protein RR075_06375, partial [Pygmaiobacter sp.]